MRTRLELQTASGSAIGTIAILLAKWEALAVQVDKAVEPAENELIVWRLVYSRYQENRAEFEASEHAPIPILFGRISLVSEFLWEKKTCPYTFMYDGLGFALCNQKGIPEFAGDATEIAKVIVSNLRK